MFRLNRKDDKLVRLRRIAVDGLTARSLAERYKLRAESSSATSAAHPVDRLDQGTANSEDGLKPSAKRSTISTIE